MNDRACPCDEWVHAEVLRIPAGLDRLPRQIAGFPEFRRAMLADLQNHPPLTGWRARGEDDMGVMLIEMWAYVCDVLAFYDQVIANEAYLRTAQLRPSLRKLVDLLGYVPRPAVAASVLLAAIVEGRKPITLPAGTPFRSQAFDDEPPQIFELDRETTIHPLNNRWYFAPIRLSTVDSDGAQSDELLFDTGSTGLKEGDVVLLRIRPSDGEYIRAGSVRSIAEVSGHDRNRYDRVAFNPSITTPGETKPEQIKLWRAAQTASPWAMEHIEPDPVPFEISRAAASSLEPESKHYSVHVEVILDGIYRSIKRGQYVVLQRDEQFQWFQVNKTDELLMHVESAGGTVEAPIPPIKAVVTRLFLNAGGNAEAVSPSSSWRFEDNDRIIVHHAFIQTATVTMDTKSTTSAGDQLKLQSAKPGALELPQNRHLPNRFLIQDKNETAHAVRGVIDPETGTVIPDPADAWSFPLHQPVTVFGNVIEASRGGTVRQEILGNGDGSIAGQSFTLKKKPLTYLSAPTAADEHGILSTLKVRVDGILWKEVHSFFGAGADDPVYIVRQTDRGETVITFGDGRRGRRLPSGRDNVVAGYRFGAGAKAPPAGTITQIAKPIRGLTGVRNPLPAAGGDDAEGPAGLREHAPASALVLGRAVSIDDFQALAAGCPGVRSVRAEWCWDGVRQGAVVKIWYIGEPGIESKVSETLRCRADPTITIDVEYATPEPLHLMLSIEIDQRYLDEDVLRLVRWALMNPEAGLLAPEHIGIGRPLFRSRIVERALSVEGALAVPHLRYTEHGQDAGMAWSRIVSFDEAALRPGTGGYFDLEAGSLLLSPQEKRNG